MGVGHLRVRDCPPFFGDGDSIRPERDEDNGIEAQTRVVAAPMKNRLSVSRIRVRAFLFGIQPPIGAST